MKKLDFMAAMGFATETVQKKKKRRRRKEKKKEKIQTTKWRGEEDMYDRVLQHYREKSVLIS